MNAKEILDATQPAQLVLQCREELAARRNTMHEAHRKAAEHHELATKAHRTAAEHNVKGETETGDWHSERALEHSRDYQLAKEAHDKSGKIETV